MTLDTQRTGVWLKQINSCAALVHAMLRLEHMMVFPVRVVSIAENTPRYKLKRKKVGKPHTLRTALMWLRSAPASAAEEASMSRLSFNRTRSCVSTVRMMRKRRQ